MTLDKTKFKKHTRDERGTFSYWFDHWRAFNLLAVKLGHWRFKYIFHDAEKPFLRLLFGGDYKRVQSWHRSHNRHHLEYAGNREIDWDALVIDWECSRFTKEAEPRTVLQEAEHLINAKKIDYSTYLLIVSSVYNLGLMGK